MKQLYLDLFSGISGDMFIGALLDLGVDFAELQRELGKLPLEGYHLHVSRGVKQGIAGTKFDVHLSHDHSHAHEGEGHPHGHHEHHGHGHAHHSHGHDPAHAHSHGTDHTHKHEEDHGGEHGRSFREIQGLIGGSGLSEWVKAKAIAVFRRIAIAEGRIHGLPPEAVHFHEVGAVDSIVDIVGACVALELLGKPRVVASLVTEGTGWVDCAHGRFPVPAPATLEILGARGIPVSQCEEPYELVTPTGAGLLAEFAESFGPMRSLVADRTGFGLGTRNLRGRPNVLRVALGPVSSAQSEEAAHSWEHDRVTLLETNLDDTTPEVIGCFMERALAEGALDVWLTPVHMKKNRPGTLLSVLCAEGDADRLAALVLTETSAFGVRSQTLERRKLPRHFVEVSTPFGPIPVKVGKLKDRVVQAAPEFEACKRAAQTAGATVKDVYTAALTALATALGSSPSGME